jgi:two-component system phosphate regulon sensor histidine kinase PhoR
MSSNDSYLPSVKSLATAPLPESQTLINAFFKEHTVLKTLLKDFRDGVLICDRDACLVQLNSSLKKLWNLDDQVLGQPVSTIVSNAVFNAAMAELLSEGSSRVVEMSWRGASGRLFFETHLIPLWIPAVVESVNPLGENASLSNASQSSLLNRIVSNGQSGSAGEDNSRAQGAPNGCVAIFHNITERRRTEKMRRDFVANVSHELRTPLSAITGYSETLLEDNLLEGEDANASIRCEFVQVIHRHSLRLTQLVEDLLDLSKLESPDYEPELTPVALEGLIGQAVSLVEDKAIEKGIELQIELSPLLPRVLAEASSLQQVLTNLLDNAIKYTPPQGRVVISAQAVTESSGNQFQLNAAVVQSGFQETSSLSNKEALPQEVEIRVSDNGIGIESKYQSRIFERFYRVDKARSRDLGGTGLGLAIVKHIVQLHGGEIRVASVVNQGSSFYFRLRVENLVS